jgi:hypothetical protein
MIDDLDRPDNMQNKSQTGKDENLSVTDRIEA